MAINSSDVACDKIPSKSQGSSKCYKNSNLPSRLVKIDFATDGSICSLAAKQGRNKNLEFKSPYFSGDNVQILSNVTEKKFVHKKPANNPTSFPLSGKLYKANSDEFKDSKNYKKMQKSVLTLPNEPAPVPQFCTVSDMNESEYFNRNDDNRKKTKKRITSGRTRKCRTRGKELEFYDRDALYCSQIDVNLDCSSSDMIKKYNGNNKNISQSTLVSKSYANDHHPHDVWAILRNINRFQFQHSPPMSDDSFIAPKKKTPKRRNNRKDMRVFERRRTEEFAYISSYEVDTKSPCSCLSQSSSFDKITVIEKKNGFSKLCRGFEEKITRKKKGVKQLGTNPNTNNKHVTKHKTIAKFNNIKETTAYRKKADNLCSDSSFIASSNNKDEIQLSDSYVSGKQGYKYHRSDANVEKRVDIQKLPQNPGEECISFGSSNVNKTITNRTTHKKFRVQKKLSPLAIHSEEAEQQINGIIKVVVNKGPIVVQDNEITKKKKLPQTNTTNTNTNRVNVPKLTKTEIQRLLNKQKYPIVILGKDQLSSTTIKVINEDPTQFEGLNKRIWPFMQNWASNEYQKNTLLTQLKQPYNSGKKIDDKCDVMEKSLLSVRLQNNGPKLSKCKEKNTNELKTNKTKAAFKRGQVPVVEKVSQMHVQAKPKPMQQLRERMLKLLYKNSTASVNEGSNNSDTNKNENNVFNVMTCNATKDSVKPKSSIRSSAKPAKYKIPPPIDKRPWAKAKWASDFIDNVIRKIKAGVYYTQENKVSTVTFDENLDKDSKEIDIETVSSIDTNSDKSSTTHSVNNEYLTIPGFDDVLPAVEIKSMNMNEISVKHCFTNIMVRFDVAVPTDSIVNLKSSNSLIPVEVTDSNTKVFKCKTSLINSMLPAELCSILPKMLQSITKTGDHLALLPISVKSSSQLSTISEVTQCENHADILSPIHPIVTNKPKSERLCRLLNGRYLHADKRISIHTVKKTSVKYDKRLVKEFTCISYKIYHLYYGVSPMMNPKEKAQESVNDKPSVTFSKEVNTCRALQPYSLAERSLVPSYKVLNIHTLYDSIVGLISRAQPAHQMPTEPITINMVTIQTPNLLNIITLSMNYHNFFISCSNSLTTEKNGTDLSNTSNDILSPQYVNISESNNMEKKEHQSAVDTCAPINNNKIRRKGYVKLYRKCKSTSNISGEKPTPLNKITSLDEFFLALGSGKSLSNVFDSQSEYKIMSSLNEMKNWTSEINPRQALLILLLANKKESINILRYKPVLLQGIAVNRITKASELDMEIEVIERENLNTFSKFEGISYVPASIENQDTLFEELCWIAKTTASDYQRPFDESSEKLLKSLLEKRKKLNPSYLRVMARYVGLGLLKFPSKK